MKVITILITLIITTFSCGRIEKSANEISLGEVYHQAKKLRGQMGYTSDYNFKINRTTDFKREVFCSELELANPKQSSSPEADQYFRILIGQDEQPVYISSYSKQSSMLNFEISLTSFDGYAIGLIYEYYDDFSHTQENVDIVNGFILWIKSTDSIYFINFYDNIRHPKAFEKLGQEDISAMMRLDNNLYPIDRMVLLNNKINSVSRYVYHREGNGLVLEYKEVRQPLSQIDLDASSTMRDLMNYEQESLKAQVPQSRRILPDVNNLKYPMWLWAGVYEYDVIK